MGNDIDIDNDVELKDYLSLLNKNQAKSFISLYFVDIETDIQDDIQAINTILSTAIETNNNNIVKEIKKWYHANASGTY